MSNTAETQAAGKEYQWKKDGTDGLRSYSYAASDSTWSYVTEPDESNKDSDDWYIYSDSSTGQPFARRGNLYNWTAATLGSGLDLTDGSGEKAPDSICPRGWKLPISFNILSTYSVNNNSTGYSRLISWPLQYLPTGYYYGGHISNTNRMWHGYWWTSTTYDGGDGDALESSNPEMVDVGSDSRGNGYALREVAGVRNFRFF